MPLHPEAVTVAVSAASNRRRAAAQACTDRYQQKLLSGQSPQRLYAEYLHEGRAIDATFENEVEPWRQHFLASNPNQALPLFLQPGFQSFSARQQLQKSPAQIPMPQAPPMIAGYPQRTWITAGVILVVGLLFFGLISSCDSRNSTESKPPPTLTSCENSMRIASLEPDSTRADPLIAATLSSCSNKTEWIAALTKFPAAMGVTYVTDGKLEHEAACSNEPSAPACKN